MDLNFKKTNLLILRGVFPRDFTASDNTVNQSKADYPVYTKIPKKFVNVEGWPKISNLKCWNCDQIFQTYPKFVPMNPERDKDGNDVCDSIGNFCEWNCVVRYINEKYSYNEQWDLLKLVCVFAAKFTGRRREKIMPSPDKTEMKQYCGEEGITPKQYREKMEQINADYDLSLYRLDDFRTGE